MASQYDAQIAELEEKLAELQGLLPQLKAIPHEEMIAEVEGQIENLEFYLRALKNLRFNELES